MESVVSLKVFDLTGREVSTLVDREELTAGRHQRFWNGRDVRDRLLSSGSYFCRFQAGSHVQTMKMTLLR